MLQRTIDNLRERPHHERRAVASSVALGVVVVLFVGWFALFIHGLTGSSSVSPSQTAAAAPAIQAFVGAPSSAPSSR